MQEPCLLWKLSTLLKLKRKGEKKRKEKGLRFIFICVFFNIIWCLFLIASRACKNIYLSFYLKEFFKKVYLVLFFYFFLLLLLFGE